MSAIGPIGVKSNLKSPVSIIVPFGVWITSAKLSGIEWVVVINSTSISLNLNLLFSSNITILSYLILLSSNFFLIKLAAWFGA